MHIYARSYYAFLPRTPWSSARRCYNLIHPIQYTLLALASETSFGEGVLTVVILLSRTHSCTNIWEQSSYPSIAHIKPVELNQAPFFPSYCFMLKPCQAS